MSKNIVFISKPAILWPRNLLGGRFFCSKVFTVKPKGSEEMVVDVKPAYEEEFEAESVMKKRNKSRLNEPHRNILMGKKPYEDRVAWFHDTVKYKRRTLGRYGMEALEVPAGLAWPLPEEVEDIKDYERVAFPKSLQERWEMLAQKRTMEAEKIKRREAQVAAAMAQMRTSIQQFRDRVDLKKKTQEEAQRKKNYLISLVRKELGVGVSEQDKQFKDLLRQKSREIKKMKREAKEKLTIEKFLNVNKKNTADASNDPALEAKEEAT